jgi:hypothetical protein
MGSQVKVAAKRKTKRFLLFSGHEYEGVIGGWTDCKADCTSLKKAQAAGDEMIKHGDDWAHIVDLNIGEIVSERRYINRKVGMSPWGPEE